MATITISVRVSTDFNIEDNLVARIEDGLTSLGLGGNIRIERIESVDGSKVKTTTDKFVSQADAEDYEFGMDNKQDGC
jgi:hypothetical protein